ncbi:MAG TPA: hypothetical protein VF678_09560, partial [bacterium]
YTHFYKKEFPQRFHGQMDTRRWGPGERLVFEPYTQEAFEQAQAWIIQHKIFPEGHVGAAGYDQAVCSIEAQP